jgi:hypothetical protein
MLLIHKLTRLAERVNVTRQLHRISGSSVNKCTVACYIEGGYRTAI